MPVADGHDDGGAGKRTQIDRRRTPGVGKNQPGQVDGTRHHPRHQRVSTIGSRRRRVAFSPGSSTACCTQAGTSDPASAPDGWAIT